ncbi:transposase [Streptomyces goshikiensis]|uniref:transposase n=1 Tax=Streptomyces goshikiensis TaxID=1942 RepID=UPI0036AAB70E
MGKERVRPRRSFTSEFKAEIVELCRRGDRSVGQIAKDFDLTETAVRSWVRQAQVDAGEKEGLTSSERGTGGTSAREPPFARGRRHPQACDLRFNRSRQRSRLVSGIPGTFADGC